MRLDEVEHVLRLTCVYLATKAEDGFADAGADNGAILRFVVDNFIFAVLNKVP